MEGMEGGELSFLVIAHLRSSAKKLLDSTNAWSTLGQTLGVLTSGPSLKMSSSSSPTRIIPILLLLPKR
jgi:hypothetical protein